MNLGSCWRGPRVLEWLVILPLGVWVLLQGQRIDALARRIGELEIELFKLRQTPQTTAGPAPAEAPLLLTDVVPDDDNVLVLDTPVPEASNDLEDVAALAPAAAPPAPPTEAPLLLDQPIAEAPRAETERATPMATAPKRLDRWLAEHGLAWVAGVAIALGAIYLVSLAAQSAWFTAPVRLAFALVLGLAVLGASEWTRRIGLRRPPGHPLVSALLAGAGLIIFYATVWAAHGLYGLIGWPGAAALMTLCVILLIGLSFLHGEALGVLAIGLAMLAPALAQAPAWPSFALSLYVCFVGGGGFALAALRRWLWVALATIAGLYFWFFAAIAEDDLRRALALLSFASLGGAAIAFRLPDADRTDGKLSWTQVRQLGPSLAISVSSALLIWAWVAIAMLPGSPVMGPALIGAFHVALAAFMIRERMAVPAVLTISIGALVLGFMIYLGAQRLALDWTLYPALLSCAFLIVLMALAAHPHRSGRALVAASGSIGAALLTALAASSRPEWHSMQAWAPLFVGAALLFAAGVRREADAADKAKDLALDFWGGGAAALALIGVESALPESWRTVGHAIIALALTAGLIWRGWRILGWAALTAGALAVSHALSPALIGGALAGHLPLWLGLLILALSAAALFGASVASRRNARHTNIGEALSAAAVIIALLGGFVLLRWIAAGGAGVALGAFMETALRALALMAAGLTLLPRAHETPGPIGAWRGHVLLGLGLLYALLVPGLGLNPWWGGPGRAIGENIPLFNSLAVAFLAPAALAFAAARQLYARQLHFARSYAAAGGALLLLWAVMELRRAFHGDAMAAPMIGLFESACYALLVLAFGLSFAIVARVRAQHNAQRPLAQDLMHAMRAVSWGALGFSGLVLLLLQHPIWGAQDSAASNALSTLLAVLAQFLAAPMALMLGRALSMSKTADPARFAAAATAATLFWSAGHAAIRWLHHRGYMDDGAALLGNEGLWHAVWPLALVIGAAQLTRLAPGRDTVRAYLHDLQAIWAAAVWPALGFAVIGFALLFSPWWGVWPAQLTSVGAAFIALCLYGLAATLSLVAPDTPHARWMKQLAPAATIASAMLLVAIVTLVARWLYHGAETNSADAGEIELWTYSAIWATFGAGALALGSVRDDPVLRWIGLGAFAVTIVKVFAVDTAELSGVVRAASFLGLGIIAAIATWQARRNQPAPGPGDLVRVRPSARRERRRIRRRTPQ
ncbi:MAG: hypothetical protein A4S17_06415 [Proteobacteria bacterium HN_bin10]|nr:MAG: hypothetical protein A4S17_06415 [Proteobacteria bacterium HN_bin10]